jgi:streptogramin lyase
MAILNTWKLPLNLPNPYPFYLQFLTPEQNGRLYYTKYIVDVIGELSVHADAHNVREWVIPQGLHAFVPGGGGCPLGITYGPKKTVWSALESGHRLIQLEPGSGTLTSYGATQGPIGSSQYNNYPISLPTDVMFDRYENAWYIGYGVVGSLPGCYPQSKGALIGRLNADRKSADIWELREMPTLLSCPNGLWVRDNGEEIWVTLYSDQPVTNVPFLARLQPSLNKITVWINPYPAVSFTGAVGIVGDSPTDPENIWFTFYDDYQKIGTYRLELETGTFYHYVKDLKTSNPKRIALADNGDAWISDWAGKISTATKKIYCNKAVFPSKTITIKPRNMGVQKRQARVKPVVHTVVPVHQGIYPVKSKCITDFPMPYGTNPPNGIAVNDTPNNPTVYFSQGSGSIIGQLIP